MEYTVCQLGKLAGISARTLRYYDEIGILTPAKVRSSGYRIYGPNEVDRLQQILFYRQLGVGLGDIRRILGRPGFDAAAALREHREKLREQRRQLDRLIANVERSIESMERGIPMSDREKFEGFKQKMADENERKYGAEAREKYGDEAVDASSRKIRGMTPEDYEKVTALEKEMTDTLCAAFETGDPAGADAQKAADLHRQWLGFYWDSYSKEAHAGLARMVAEDGRFRAYYDKIRPGLADFLRDAVLVYTGRE